MVNRVLIIGSLILAALIPLAVIALRRNEHSPTPRFHIMLGMDKMAYRKPQRPSKFFADGRAMRPHIPGTMARQDFIYNNEAQMRVTPNNWKLDHVVLSTRLKYERVLLGQVLSGGQGRFINHMPIPVTKALVHRGQQQFDIFCMPCHGANGRGNGLVNQWVHKLRQAGSPDAGTWVRPTDLTSPAVTFLPDGGIYSIIANGIAGMPAYKDQIPVVDRWAIVAYVRALGLSSKTISAARLPAKVRASLTVGNKQ